MGGSGYSVSPYLITLLKRGHNEQQYNFNPIHSSERVVIERVFGQCNKLFPILGHCVRISIDRVSNE